MLQGLTRRHDAYLFGRTGVLAVECCRMALALVYLLMNSRHPLTDAAAIRSSYPVSNYVPDGILMAFGTTMPSDALIDTMILLSRVFPVLLLLGLFSRVSLFGTLFTHLFLRSLVESFSAGWSHGFNVVFLAHLGFLFAPVGQRLSLDAWIRSIRGREPRPEQDGFWAVVCGQWCVALMFASAFYWKALYNTRPPFAWAHWENMRNQLLNRYEWCGDAVPGFLQPVLESPFLCGTLAWGNLLFQFMPFVSLFFLDRPVVRALLGLGFVMEEIGLAWIMGLADLHWLPLIAFFVDWDHFLGKWGAKQHAGPAWVPRKGWKKAYACGLITIYLMFSLNVTGPAFGYNVFDLRAYPFSQFSMYSGYFKSDLEGTFATAGTTFKLETGTFTDKQRAVVERILKRRFYGAHSAGSEEVRGVLVKALEWANDSIRTGFPGVRVSGLAMYRTLHEFRTDTAHLCDGPSGLIGRVGAGGTCITAARFIRHTADTAMISLENGCGSVQVVSVATMDASGIPANEAFRAQAGVLHVPMSALDGHRYALFTLADSARCGAGYLLFEITFED
ncbi:MAG: hypothetical protein IPK99_01010 [Flavobacteriales bacterium]|nr:hypothetical protein [Flavobacteriales bacterium]